MILKVLTLSVLRDEGLEEAMNQLPSALVENTGPAFRSKP